jgi:uncharacterized surface protein with fasciclin (FAS1) repeats
LIKKVIEYHTVGSFYPAGRVIHHRTIPTLLEAEHGPKLTQKVRFGFGPHGPALNFYVHPVFIDIFTSNGVVHAIDNLLIPPPPTYFILQLVPTVFSTFFQALHQTHVVKDFFPWKKSPSSWTAFVPGNFAWTKIPPVITAWLFSPRGHHILTKLVEYHISPNTTFYTDSIWKFPKHNKTAEDPALVLPESNLPPEEEDFPHPPPHHKPPPHRRPGHRRPHHPPWPKLHFNTTLPTLIGGNATLRIDEFIFGPFVKIGINRRPSGIRVNDLLAYDGVIHILDRFVLPPRHRKCHGKEEEETLVTGWAEEEDWTIENLEAMFGGEEM